MLYSLFISAVLYGRIGTSKRLKPAAVSVITVPFSVLLTPEVRRQAGKAVKYNDLEATTV